MTQTNTPNPAAPQPEFVTLGNGKTIQVYPDNPFGKGPAKAAASVMSEDERLARTKKYDCQRFAATSLAGVRYKWARDLAEQIARFNAQRDPAKNLPKLVFKGSEVSNFATDAEIAVLGAELPHEEVYALQLEAAAIRDAAQAQIKQRAKEIAADRSRDDTDHSDHNAGPGGLFLNVETLLDGGIHQPMPTVLTRRDGKCLFYKGKGNVIYGDPETAKTWIALAAGAEVLCGGGRFVFLDLDHNGAADVVSRLRMMGVPVAVLRDPARFLYLEPLDAENIKAAVAELVKVKPDMVVIDSMGELLPMFGANSNDNDEFTNVNREVMAPLAHAGAAVVVIDHLAKNAESRRLGAVGAFAKMRVVNGTMVRVFSMTPFTPGHGGTSSLWIHKDRPGNVRRETVLSSGADNGDSEDIKRDNLRRWGVFTMCSAPVLDKRGQRVVDAGGNTEESLSWVVHPPKGLDSAGADMPDPRGGGRPRGGISVVGSPKYDAAVESYLTTLCRLRREGRATDKTNKGEAADLVASTLGLKQPSREAWSEAWSRWYAAERPDTRSDIDEVTPTDPFA